MERHRQMYLIYTKLNIQGTFVLCDDDGNAVISPDYLALTYALSVRANLERFAVSSMTYAEFLMEQEGL